MTPEEVAQVVIENARMRSMLTRAIEHGLNGNIGYHALMAGDLGDEIRQFLGMPPVYGQFAKGPIDTSPKRDIEGAGWGEA